MRFRAYESLRLFTLVAEEKSFSQASEALNLSKGAISYRIKQLEDQLGFAVFERRHRGAHLTGKGEKLFHASRVMFDGIEREIDNLRASGEMQIIVAMTTYFAARWLSSRLMRFISAHPHVTIRLQPTVGIVDPNHDAVDIVIRWGKGAWNGMTSERLFCCPASLVAAPAVAERLTRDGLKDGLASTPLLDDDQQSPAWADWCRMAGVETVTAQERLIVPDPNVRLQAVIDGQGVALFDELANEELLSRRIVRVGEIELPEYGYHLIYRRDALANAACRAFRDWIVGEASGIPGQGRSRSDI